jgi:hypothetical protein
MKCFFIETIVNFLGFFRVNLFPGKVGSEPWIFFIVSAYVKLFWSTKVAPPIDIESLQNRLLKVCYVPATSAGLSRLLFAVAIISTNEANKAGGTLF